MSELERYVPPEAQEKAKTEKMDKANLSPETISAIQKGLPEAAAKPESDNQPKTIGTRIHWRTPDGNLITPEKEELYRSPETLPEKEPGFGPKPSISDDPGQTASDDQNVDDTSEE